MMKSVSTFLVIFLCTYQELVGGTPITKFFQKALSNTVGRLFSKNKSSTYQGSEADYSIPQYDSADSPVQLEPVYNAEHEVEITSADVPEYSVYFKELQEKLSLGNSDSENQIHADQIQAIYNKIHNAPGAITEIEFLGEKTKVNVGERGTAKRLKNETDTLSYWNMFLDALKSIYKWVKKWFVPKKEKKPGADTSKSKMEAGKQGIPNRPSSLGPKGAESNSLDLSKPTSPLQSKEKEGTDGSSASSVPRENASAASHLGSSQLVQPLKPESETPCAKAAKDKQHGDGLGSDGHNSHPANGGQVHESSMQDTKENQNDKESKYLLDLKKQKRGEENGSLTGEQEGFISLMGNNHVNPGDPSGLVKNKVVTETPTLIQAKVPEVAARIDDQNPPRNIHEKEYFEAIMQNKQGKSLDSSTGDQSALVGLINKDHNMPNVGVLPEGQNDRESEYLLGSKKRKEGGENGSLTAEQEGLLGLIGNNQGKLRPGDMSGQVPEVAGRKDGENPDQNTQEKECFKDTMKDKAEKALNSKTGDQAALVDLMGKESPAPKVEVLSEGPDQNTQEKEYFKDTMKDKAGKVHNSKTGDQAALVDLMGKESQVPKEEVISEGPDQNTQERQYFKDTMKDNAEKALNSKTGDQAALVDLMGKESQVPKVGVISEGLDQNTQERQYFKDTMKDNAGKALNSKTGDQAALVDLMGKESQVPKVGVISEGLDQNTQEKVYFKDTMKDDPRKALNSETGDQAALVDLIGKESQVPKVGVLSEGVEETEEERKKKLQNQKEKQYLSETESAQTIEQKLTAQQQDQKDLIGIARNAHVEPAAGYTGLPANGSEGEGGEKAMDAYYRSQAQIQNESQEPSKVKDAQSQNGEAAKPKAVDGSVVSELLGAVTEMEKQEKNGLTSSPAATKDGEKPASS